MTMVLLPRALVPYVLVLGVALGTHPDTMRAVVATGVGKAEGDFSKVKLEEARSVPTPGRGQVLIQVRASSINPVDWKLLSNWAFHIVTFFSTKVLGFDVAGTVVAVGSDCQRLKVGDEVWADLGKSSLFNPIELGAWAEHALADESQVGLKPTTLSFEEAGALPLVALTGLQALRMTGAPWAGRENLTVVVTSGSGGTGHVGVQLAKAYGATRIVTAASSHNAAWLKELGATDVIDYHTTTLWDYLGKDAADIVYDNYGAAGTADLALDSIRAGGAFVFLPGKGGKVSKKKKAGVKEINFGLCDSSHYSDMDELRKTAEAGQLKPHISARYHLETIRDALNASFSGHAAGKISINTTKPDVPAFRVEVV